MNPSQFNNPWRFSFKDGLAIAMCLPFIISAFKYMIWHQAPDLSLVNALKAIIIVVLSGYFGQEAATAYFAKDNNNYGYSYFSNPTPTNPGTPTVSTPEQNQDGPL